MRDRLKKMATVVDAQDILAFTGLGLLCYGLHMIYPPAAFIAGGSALFWLGAGR